MGNPWIELRNMFPTDSVFIGEVTGIDATSESSTVRLLSGESIKASGTSVSIGTRCFIERGVITGEAPNLTVYSVTLY